MSCATAPSAPPIAVAPAPSAIAAPEESALTLNNQGVGKLQRQDYEGAITAFAAAIKLNPNLAEAYLGRGIGYSVRRDHKAAIADYDKALALKPDLAEAYLYRADDLLALQQKAQAITDLQQAQTLFTRRDDTKNAKAAQSRLVALQSPTVKARVLDPETSTSPVSPVDSTELTPEPTVATEPVEREPAEREPAEREATPIRAPMTGQCDCPYDFASNGSSCGRRSAYSRPGGREPICYANDES